jgi:hypothetical protein
LEDAASDDERGQRQGVLAGTASDRIVGGGTAQETDARPVAGA